MIIEDRDLRMPSRPDLGRLVLTRRTGEDILIGDDIIVRVVRIDREVRLAIYAPRSVTITRSKGIAMPPVAPAPPPPPVEESELEETLRMVREGR